LVRSLRYAQTPEGIAATRQFLHVGKTPRLARSLRYAQNSLLSMEFY
jgi:hypothetical protein